jgi:VWFA-related protein
MRVVPLLFVLTAAAFAQFRSTTQLVVAPVTVTDAKGRFVDGLTAEDLVLTDNSVPRPIQIDWTTYPIDLVVAVQTSANSGPVIDKLGDTGILFSQMLAGGAGETAMISFSDSVKVHQDFTSDSDAVTHAMGMLRMEGGGAHALDAIRQALKMLAARPPGRRRIILMIAEKRDRGSNATLPEVMAEAQRANAAVYWVTWSPFLQQFTVKNKVKEDLKPKAEQQPFRACIDCPRRDETPVPYEPGPGGWAYGLGELVHLARPDLSTLFTETTGGRALNFLRKDALEEAIQLISLEVHRQYIVTFEAPRGEPGIFHPIQVWVKGKPELRVTTRSGYWTVE